MRRVVIDTSVLATALRSATGAGNRVFRWVALGRLTPLATPALFLEYEDVLKRPEQRLVHGFGTEQLDQFLSGLASAIEPVEIRFQWRPQLQDPGNEMVLEAAVNGRADALITYNVKDFNGPARRFRLPVLRPGQLIKALQI